MDRSVVSIKSSAQFSNNTKTKNALQLSVGHFSEVPSGIEPL